MEAYYDLKKTLCKELEKVAEKKEMSAGDLDVIDKLTHSIKSLLTIMAMEESGYSNEGGNSGARGRSGMGRYNDGGYSGRSYEDGYSGRRYNESGRRSRDSYLMGEIERLMNEASMPEEREVLQSAVNRLRNM